MRTVWLWILAATVGTLASAPALAQISNEPYNFPRSGGLGMSNAAKAAIINQELTGRTPDNILRGAGGNELITVEEGPGGSAFARTQSGAVIPGFRGRADFRAPNAFAGSFNAYFASSGGGSVYGYLNRGGSGAISMWTYGVFRETETGLRVSPAALKADSIDAWTAQVGGL
jgi:hypothetical protein